MRPSPYLVAKSPALSVTILRFISLSHTFPRNSFSSRWIWLGSLEMHSSFPVNFICPQTFLWYSAAIADMALLIALVLTSTPIARSGAALKIRSHCSSDSGGVSACDSWGLRVATRTPNLSGSSPAVTRHLLARAWGPSLFLWRLFWVTTLPSVSRPKYSSSHVVSSSASKSPPQPCASCVHTMGLPEASSRVFPVHASHVLPVREYLRMRSGRSCRSSGLPRSH
mmetsp:Transcript_16439/g.35713  ORF Transcript_16439/g.35713 Transcript_16439/m.35713 type:complete len:225 (-) Transcript_16439:60-734(-)